MPEPPPLPRRTPPTEIRLKGVPFPLRADERILVRGGFGGIFAWVWVCTFLPMTLCCWSPLVLVEALRGGMAAKLLGVPLSLILLAAAFWPLIRSGRYWLTTRRLVWKPRLGRTQMLDFATVRPDDIRAGFFGRTLRVPGRPTIVVRYVGGLERLWGGLVLMTEADDLDLTPQGAGVTDVAWWVAARGKRASYQLGIAVLRPDYVAFLPTAKTKNLVGEFLDHTVGKAAREVLGRGDRGHESAPAPPFDVLLGLLSERSPEAFDEFVWEAVDRHDGLWWDAGRATAGREAIPARPSRVAVVFSREAEKIRGLPALDQEPTVTGLLHRWARGAPIPRRYPVLKMSLIATFLLVVGGIFVYTGRKAEEPVVEVGKVSVADVMDSAIAPDGSFVTVTGTPDWVRARRLAPKKKNGPADLLVVLSEAPGLILHVPEDHELSKALKESEKQPRKKGSPLAKPGAAEWTASGRLYAEGPNSAKVPISEVRDYESKVLKADSATRVLMVGVGPVDLKMSWRIPYTLAVLFGGAGVLLAGVIVRALLAGRWDRY